MSIFYENILNKITNTYFEEELSTKLKIVSMLEGIKNHKDKEEGKVIKEDKVVLDPNLKIINLEEDTVYVQNEDKTYCLVKINGFLYSFSFMKSSKVSIASGLALTFGLVNNDNLTVSKLAGLSKMLNYRDSTTKAPVGPTTILKLWKIILAYFKKTFPNNKLIYRSDLEDHEHAVLSNINEFLKIKSATKKELNDKIDAIITTVDSAKTYENVALDDGKGHTYYGNERDLSKAITQQDKKDMKKALNYLKKLIEKSGLDKLNEQDILKIFNKFERKKIIRTSLYSKITQKIFGITKTGSLISNINKDNIDDVLEKIREQITIDAVIDLNGTKIRIINDDEIKKLITDIATIINNTKINDEKKKENLNDLVDDFYANNIQTIDYKTNKRYVVMNI